MSTAVPQPFKEILVPLDGSPAAERALPPALELVRLTGVPLRVLQRALTDDVEDAAAYLAGVAARHAGETDIETVVVDRESIPDAILDGLGPETLVCMSSHGRGGLGRALVGSVAEALLRTIDRPVLVVGPHVADRVTFTGRVVTCIDGSDHSERTIEPARAWAAALGLPLWLVEVAVPSTPVEWFTEGGAAESADLARLARRFGDVVGWDTFHNRHPARELVDISSSEFEPTALLVMATHGRTGWNRLRLGSVTAATVHAATVPVLVVPANATEPVGLARTGHEGATRP
jgi:nucleotide-binding universal stress UspA family protein